MSKETQKRAVLPTRSTQSTDCPLPWDPSGHFCTVSEIIEFLYEMLETRFLFIKEVL